MVGCNGGVRAGPVRIQKKAKVALFDRDGVGPLGTLLWRGI